MEFIQVSENKFALTTCDSLSLLVKVASVAVADPGVKARHLLVRSSVARVGLVHSVGRGSSSVGSIGISGPLAVAGVELSPLLERAGSTGVRLADSVARGQFVSVDVVAVLK